MGAGVRVGVGVKVDVGGIFVGVEVGGDRVGVASTVSWLAQAARERSPQARVRSRMAENKLYYVVFATFAENTTAKGSCVVGGAPMQ